MNDKTTYDTHYSNAESYMQDAHLLDFGKDQPRALVALGFAQVNAQLAAADALQKLIDVLTPDQEAEQPEEVKPDPLAHSAEQCRWQRIMPLGPDVRCELPSDHTGVCSFDQPEAEAHHPLDEDDYRDRMTRDGNRLTRHGLLHWHLSSGNPATCSVAHEAGLFSLNWWDKIRGPLSFAPEESPTLQGDAEREEVRPDPDPLDENDHRDRLDRAGDIVRRKGHKCWAWPEVPGFHDDDAGWSLSSLDAGIFGPLTFAPDTSATQEDAEQKEVRPDPLDENDHRNRIDKDGDIYVRHGHEHWHFPSDVDENEPCPTPALCDTSLRSLDAMCGPLTFAPDDSPGPQDAAEDTGDAVEECGTAGPSEVLRCHECGHDINCHAVRDTSPDGCVAAGCPCPLWPSQIARHLIAQASS